MGPLAQFLAKEHARLDGFIARAQEGPPGVLLEPFGAFRQGLLRHIGLEETILLPALLKYPEAPVQLAAKLRLDHGALTNLLLPTPSQYIVQALLSILEPHNRLEEEPGGFYAACDTLLAAEAPGLIAKMRAAPELPLRPYSTRPEALEAAKRAMQRAGFAFEGGVSRPPSALSQCYNEERNGDSRIAGRFKPGS